MKELTLKELQDEELKIMKDVHAFCTQNNIRYSLYGGTLIGAIRHNGFIPWDDDIDIIMPRPDYDRFFKIYKSDNYRAINHDLDKKCYTAFGRVCDKVKTIAVSRIPWCTSDDYGVFIDVFPADGFSENEEERKNAYERNHYLLNEVVSRRRALIPFYKESTARGVLGLLYKKIRYLGGVRTAYYTEKLIHENKSIPYGTTSLWATISHVINPKTKKHFPLDTFSECLLHGFEDTECYVMKGYDEVLRSIYGDYMKLPPKEKRVPLQQSYIRFYWR